MTKDDTTGVQVPAQMVYSEETVELILRQDCNLRTHANRNELV
jgi:hypothetical protein